MGRGVVWMGSGGGKEGELWRGGERRRRCGAEEVLKEHSSLPGKKGIALSLPPLMTSFFMIHMLNFRQSLVRPTHKCIA